MTVFNTFLKVLNKNKFIVILYTVILVFFGAFNMSTSDNQISFEATKPKVLVVNQDENKGITKNLVEYIQNNCEIVDIKDDEEAREDALFYRDVSYIIYIPKNYRQDILNGESPEIEVKSTGDYSSSYAEMMLSRYLRLQDIYVKEQIKEDKDNLKNEDNKANVANTQESVKNEDKVIEKIDNSIAKQADIEVTSKLDAGSLSKATFYYNFASYSILAGAIYVICMILATFQSQTIRKRTIISSMNYKKHNRILLLGNTLFAIVLWLFYILLSFVLIGEAMFSTQGLIYIINSFIFTLCAVTIAFLIGNLVNNKNAVNGIVNVVALGSSFLCGAFVPVEWLPDGVLTFAHILPTYWYIQTNELMKEIEVFNLETLKPVLINMGVILAFCIIFIMLANIVSKKKRKIA